jgi:arylsulfatase A-like enzyme
MKNGASLLLVLTVCTLTVSACGRVDSGRSADRPNVVLIYADDVGYGDLSSYGATAIKTPNIDALASAGLRFTDAHSPASRCSASRYSLMTGRYAFRAADPLLQAGEYLEAGAPATIEVDRLTLPRLFQQAGYGTDAVGKWHLGVGRESGVEKLLRDEDIVPGPLDLGFDTFYGFFGDRHFAPDAWAEGRRLLRDEQGELVRPVLHTTMDRLVERSEEIIARRSRERRPFFLYLAPTNVHQPFSPAERFWFSSEAGAYGDFVVELDAAVGRIVAALEAAGTLEATLIVFTSDNGPPRTWHVGQTAKRRRGVDPEYIAAYQERTVAEHDSAAPFRGLKGDLTEGGHRVPMVVTWPGRIAAGGTTDSLVSHLDLLATFAQMLSHPLPEEAAEDSFGILPLLLGTESMESGRTSLYIWRDEESAVRAGPWKYTQLKLRRQGPGEMQGQLYNLNRDPLERRNRARSSPELVSEMAGLLHNIRTSERTRN